MRTLTVLASFTAAATLSAPAGAQPFANAKSSRSGYTSAAFAPRGTCEALAGFRANELVVDERVGVAARAIAADGATPEHCRVSGTLSPEIAFEVNLPARWNGRLYMIGNGGLAGEAPDDPGRAAQRVSALAHGFVMASTNTGHDARKEPSGTFVLSNPQKAVDYAYRAVHVTAVTAKAVANAYYAKPVDRAYWNSCSNGGRQGLIEAQRYPEDFDGIVANAPWVEQTGFIVGALWNQRAVTDNPLSADKVALVAKHVMATCDAVDGLTDGLIDDPRNCAFDPARDVPSCPAGRRLRRVPHAGPSRHGREDLRRRRERRQAVVPGLHARQRGPRAPVRTAQRRAVGRTSSCRANPTPNRPTSGSQRGCCVISSSRRRSPTTTSADSISTATWACSTAGASSRTRTTRTCRSFARAEASC